MCVAIHQRKKLKNSKFMASSSCVMCVWLMMTPSCCKAVVREISNAAMSLWCSRSRDWREFQVVIVLHCAGGALRCVDKFAVINFKENMRKRSFGSNKYFRRSMTWRSAPASLPWQTVCACLACIWTAQVGTQETRNFVIPSRTFDTAECLKFSLYPNW